MVEVTGRDSLRWSCQLLEGSQWGVQWAGSWWRVAGVIVVGWVAVWLFSYLVGALAYLIVGALVVGGGVYLYGRAKRSLAPGHPQPAADRGRGEDVPDAQPVSGPGGRLGLRSSPHLLTNGKLRRV